MSATILKTGFSLAIIVAIIALLQTTAALDAILLFAAAGVVPGTDIKLTPTATIWTLVAFAALSLLLIFSTNIVRAIRSWRAIRRVRAEAKRMIAEVEAPALVPVMAAPAIDSAPAVAAAETIVAEVSEKEQPQPVVVIKLPGKPGYISRALRAIGAALATAFVLIGEQLPVLRREIISRTSYAIGVCGLYYAYAWRWLKPRLIKAEKYLDAKLNGHQDITFVIDFLRSASKVLGKWWADGRAFAVSTWRKLSRKIA